MIDSLNHADGASLSNEDLEKLVIPDKNTAPPLHGGGREFESAQFHFVPSASAHQ